MKDEIDSLLEKITESRDKLEEYISSAEKLKGSVEKIFPEKLTDARAKWTIEERLKTATGFYDSLLKLRQELHKTIKDEIEIRRKISDRDKGDKEDDIRRIVEALEENKEN